MIDTSEIREVSTITRRLIEGDSVVISLGDTHAHYEGKITHINGETVRVQVAGKVMVCRPWQLRRVGHGRGEREQP